MCYNRFRYYSPESGTYISQDPIGLASGEPNFYAYVSDSNSWVDVFGLNSTALANSMKAATGGVKPINTQAHHVIPTQVWNTNSTFFKDIGLAGQRDHFFNGIALPDSANSMKGSGYNVFHQGSHKNYNNMVEDRLSRIVKDFDDELIDEKGARKAVRKL
ncbi:AHH domain-containing protein [Cellulophaga sp. 20_2_10]|nr:AHH domain-containing protein [Cellulophaga sp. 20_2_10]